MSLRVALACLPILWMACSGGKIRPISSRPMERLPFDATKDAAWKRADSLWELRAEPSQARAALQAYLLCAKRQPRVPALLTRISRAYHFVATYGVDNPETSDALYKSGAEYARRALRLNSDFARVLEESGDETEAAREIDGPFLEPLFWLASNVGRRLTHEDAYTRQAHQRRLGAFADVISQRSDTLVHSGADRFLGVYHLFTVRPDLDSSEYHFNRARERNPSYFANLTLRAEYLDVARGDSAAFRRNLEAVIQAPDDSLPGMTPENKLEKSRAKKLLAETDQIFR